MREELRHYSTHILLLGSILDVVAYTLDATGEYLLLSGVVKVLALVAKFIPQGLANESKSN
jgi:hypothetical protein